MFNRFTDRILGGASESSSESISHEEYYQLFCEYLNNLNSDKAEELKNKLLATKRFKVTSRIELDVPEIWKKDFNQRVLAKSIMSEHLKSRTTTSDRIIQPVLLSVEDQYSQISIPLVLKKFVLYDIEECIKKGNLSELLLDSISSQMAEYIDREIVSTIENDQSAIGSILTTKMVMDHPSKGMSTVGGYVDLDLNNPNAGDAFIQAYFNLPNGYKMRANWVMNEKTASLVKTLKITPSESHPREYLVENRDMNAPLEKLLDKNVLINKHMPDTGFIAFIAETNRGYIIAKPFDMKIFISKSEDGIALQTYMAGQVIQPACYKLIRTQI